MGQPRVVNAPQDEQEDDDEPDAPEIPDKPEPSGPAPEVETIDPDTTDPEDVQQTDAVVEEDDFEDGGLFSGVEEGTRDTDEVETDDDTVEDAFDDAEMGEDVDPEDPAGMGQPELADSGIATAINEGAARMAVVGLEDPEQSDLEDEFVEVFEAFGLGKNGARFADEYLMVEGEQVDPAWALASTAMACAIFAIYMRPDRDEQMDKIANVVGGIGGGGAGGDLSGFDGVNL